MLEYLERPSAWRSLVELEDCEEGFLGYLYGANLLHALLALLLLLQELALTRDVTAVALGCHVLADGFDGLAGNDFRADGGLDGDVELLARDELFEFLAHAAAEAHGIVHVSEGRQGVDALAVEEDVELDELALAVVMDVVVEGRIALGDTLELVVEVDNYLAQRHIEYHLHAVAGDVLLLDELAALAQTECHDGSDELCRGDDGGAYVGFFDIVDEGGVGQARGVVYLYHAAAFVVDAVAYIRHGGDDKCIALFLLPAD